jgi:hypothetical protein
MTIRPQLGFRLCFLQKTSGEASYQHEDIKPLTDLLYTATVDSLTERPDFIQILRHKYPALFLAVSEEGMTISDLLVSSVRFLIE